AILARGARVVAIDRDPDAIAAGRDLLHEAAASGRDLKLVEGRFSELDRHANALGHEAVDGVVLDLGVSSMQLDEAERGFSFRFDGPLDMRMEKSGPSAADLVNSLSERELADLIHALGEERTARAIARAIVVARAAAPIERTLQLAEIVRRAVRARGHEPIDPATRTFQALRMRVNDELGEIE